MGVNNPAPAVACNGAAIGPRPDGRVKLVSDGIRTKFSAAARSLRKSTRLRAERSDWTMCRLARIANAQRADKSCDRSSEGAGRARTYKLGRRTISRTRWHCLTLSIAITEGIGVRCPARSRLRNLSKTYMHTGECRQRYYAKPLCESHMPQLLRGKRP